MCRSQPINGRVTKAKYSTSDQQKRESGVSRVTRDTGDCNKIYQFLNEHNLFEQSSKSLGYIVSGVVVSSAVNVDKAAEIGQKIIEDIKFSTVDDYTFKKRLQAVNMSHKFRLSDKDGSVDIDLFQQYFLQVDEITLILICQLYSHFHFVLTLQL